MFTFVSACETLASAATTAACLAPLALSRVPRCCISRDTTFEAAELQRRRALSFTSAFAPAARLSFASSSALRTKTLALRRKNNQPVTTSYKLQTFRTGRVKITKDLPTFRTGFLTGFLDVPAFRTGRVKGFLDCLAFPTFRTVREKGFLDSPMFPTGRVTCFLGAPTFRTGINEIVVAFGPKELFRCHFLPRCTSRLSARRNGC